MFSNSLHIDRTVFRIDFVLDDTDEVLYSFPLNVCPQYTKGQLIKVKNNGRHSPHDKPWVTIFKVKSVDHNIMVTYETYVTTEYYVNVRLTILEENWGAIVPDLRPTE